MPLKRAQFISYGNDTKCEEIRNFIEAAGIILDIRDIEKQPLTDREISRLVGHFDLRHFLNPLSRAYSKHHLDESLPERDEIIRLITEDHTLLRRPIISTGRLVTIGCDKKSVSDMLQIGSNGHKNTQQERHFNTKHKAAASSK
jgi:arsenate reductase-like glutaredoxin family protein